MFSGIVTTDGGVVSDCCDSPPGHKTITIQTTAPLTCKVGDSMSVNGVCLTVTKHSINTFECTLVPETLQRSTLSTLQIGQTVNLEASLNYGAAIGGHMVQGHVDDVAQIIALETDHQTSLLCTFRPRNLNLMRYVIDKGFIAIDGMSITVIRALADSFTVTFIPHTREHTIVKNYHLGSWVNIEVDQMAKYIEKIVEKIYVPTPTH